MIECLFTVDYEIYGNGAGSLRELVVDPAERLLELFLKWKARLVLFVEAAELDRIESEGSDAASPLVGRQIREYHRAGFEIGLHLHPQWARARYQQGTWRLDETEYNLCTLPPERIEHIVSRAIEYLRTHVGDADFIPLSYRAGNWLFQPTQAAARVLKSHGLKVDSSVFKGGLQHRHGLDYRRALKNGWTWRFESDVNAPDPRGGLVEFPIYTRMTPFWNMLTSKRVRLQRKGPPGSPSIEARWLRLRDFLRFRQPLKLDFCRLTLDEMTRMMEEEIARDRMDPAAWRPMVAIGHTKDFQDWETLESFLSYLRDKAIPVRTFRELHELRGF